MRYANDVQLKFYLVMSKIKERLIWIYFVS